MRIVRILVSERLDSALHPKKTFSPPCNEFYLSLAVNSPVPSAQTEATVLHDFPRFPQSASAASRAVLTSRRAIIEKPPPEWANEAHAGPKKLSSSSQIVLSPQETRAFATANVPAACAQATPHL